MQLREGIWWVDEIGGFHNAEDVDSSFDSLFLRHLGQLKLEVNSKRISITWDVHEVSSSTVTGVIEGLNQYNPRACVFLRYYYFGWAEELYPGPDALRIAAQRMAMIQRFKSVEMVRPTQIKVCDLNKIKTASSLIKRSYEMWCQTGGEFEKSSPEDCSEQLPNVLIYRPDVHTGKLVFSWVGSRSLSAIVHGRRWAAMAIRQASNIPQGSEQDDYVAQISSAYQHVWDTGEPHYSQIRTLLTFKSKDPKWLSYQRLLMRYNLHDGRPALICLSSPSPEINIPLVDVT